jgi:hypothetical protein
MSSTLIPDGSSFVSVLPTTTEAKAKAPKVAAKKVAAKKVAAKKAKK